MRLEDDRRFQAVSGWFTDFFHSNTYIVLLTFVGSVGFVFSMEIEAIYVGMVLVVLSWIFCKDFLPSLLGALILGMVPLAHHGAAIETFASLFYLIPFLLFGFLFHLFAFKGDFRFGKFFFTTLAVAIAVTLGGTGVLALETYFSMPALYYVFFLGFGLLFIYVLLEAYTPRDERSYTDLLARMMVGVGVMGIVMFAHGIRENWAAFVADGPAGYFQWRNNLANNLLLVMPFSFYLATKRRYGAVFFGLGILQFFALILAYSRGGIIFGALALPFCIVGSILLARGRLHRFSLVLMLFIMGALFYFFFEEISLSPGHVVERLVERVLSTSPDEARAYKYHAAWENFQRYPVFGHGLAYVWGGKETLHPMMLDFYYSTFFQVLASLGVVGVLVYAYQAVVRLYVLFKGRSRFNLFFAFALLGFAGYSMVNLGYFIPLPFVAVLVHIFLVADRQNALMEKDEKLCAEERLFRVGSSSVSPPG